MEICEDAKVRDVEKKHHAELDQQIYKAYQALNETTAGPATEEERQEALKKAQTDPEIQRIMADPVMQQILQQMQSNPAAIQEHMRNPVVAANIRKLISCGIIRMGQIALIQSSHHSTCVTKKQHHLKLIPLRCVPKKVFSYFR